jgi:hypothetical protein
MLLSYLQQQLIAKDDKRLGDAERACQIHEVVQRLSSRLAQAYQKQQAAAVASMTAKDVEVVMIQVRCMLVVYVCVP